MYIEVEMDEEEKLPPLPTTVRLSARYRGAPKASQHMSLRLFIALILLVSAMGWHGIRTIGEFLYLMDQRYAHPSPSPTPEIEIRFEPSTSRASK
ncbi:hypothetical protein [Armatimonas sp.]|uniref:hypothetical protein n=1 Tax=Armatimonas sp. TaxID=1872638 RepID=UPI003751D8A2